MKNSKLIIYGFIHSFLASAYVASVSWLLFNGENFFGQAKSFFLPTALLMLFVVSAAITGLLVFGRPIYLFLNGAKKEAIKLLFWTIGWLMIITLIIFLVLLIK